MKLRFFVLVCTQCINRQSKQGHGSFPHFFQHVASRVGCVGQTEWQFNQVWVPIIPLNWGHVMLLSLYGFWIWTVWDILGAGFSSSLMLYYCNLYFPIIIAWALFYFIACFTDLPNSVPWSKCNQSWSTPDCIPGGVHMNGSGTPAVEEFWE